MRTGSQDAATGHRTRVADPPAAAASGVVVGSGGRINTAKADIQTTISSGSAGVTISQASAAAQQSQQAASNFEYDDNEWDIGIGDLIIDLDADIEKTNEGANSTHHQLQAQQAMATNAGAPGSGKTQAKMAIEHSATVDKGLKMKIKRTKPGTKTSEAKHEIVKSNEQQNGNVDGVEMQQNQKPGSKHPAAPSGPQNSAPTNTNSGGGGGGNSKRGSSGHRRDKTRDKHSSSSSSSSSSEKPQQNATNNNSKVAGGGSMAVSGGGSVQVAEVNGIVRLASGQAQQPPPQRPVFPASTGPGPPQQPQQAPQVTGAPPASPANAATAPPTATVKQEPGTNNKMVASTGSTVQQTPNLQPPSSSDDNSTSPPPAKKIKTEIKVSSFGLYFYYGFFFV